MPYIQHNWGPYVLEFVVDDDLIKILLDEGAKSRKNNLDYRNQLAGQIEEEFYYKDYDWFLSGFQRYLTDYMNGLEQYAKTTHIEDWQHPYNSWTLGNLWINYQKANEYNPPHKHSGDLSFVIYLQVPDEIKREHSERIGQHRNEGPGMILFDYGMDMPFSRSRIRHMPKTGDAFIFPAWLVHHVHAFKSDVERISVSGNIILNKKATKE